MVKLLFVILHEKFQRIEAAVEDKNGAKRIVNFNWRTKEKGSMPDHWLQAVEAELDHQDSEALARSSGRQLMGRRFPIAPKKPKNL